MNIFPKIGADRSLELRRFHVHNAIKSLHHKGKCLPQVTNDELQSGILIEDAAKNEANHMNRCFNMPAPACADQHIGDRRIKARIGSINHSLGRLRGVKIERDVKRLSSLQNWPEKLIIKVASLDVTIDDGSLEMIIPYGAFQLGGCGFWISSRQYCKPSKTLGMTLYCICQKVIRFAGNLSCFLHIQLLHARRVER